MTELPTGGEKAKRQQPIVDAHAHIYSLGKELSYLSVTGTQSFAEVVEKVRARVKEVSPGEWITGGRWDHNDWEDKKFPVHDALSEVSPDNPVFLCYYPWFCRHSRGDYRLWQQLVAPFCGA